MGAQRNSDGQSITEAELVRLLARLAPDRERAALEYERLRRTLVKFFDWRGVSPADEYADQALDRLARKLAETPVEDVWSYARGIARLLLLEHRRRPAPVSLEEAGDPLARPLTTSLPGEEQLFDCFERCLAQLPADSQLLVVRYYQGERRAKIANRRQLAAALSLSENALRSKVQRLRDRLEECVQACVARSEMTS
jgi:DNA-directed RNA polymerase specialized sigma24 family protein